MEFDKGTTQLIARYREWNQNLQPTGNVTTISVDEVAARVASFYEKIRGVVDWREEHLLRKTALERIFKRRMLLNGNTQEMAEPLIHELIRGGHFPNNRIPVSKIDEVQQVISKYAFLIHASKEYVNANKHAGIEQWLLSIGACEIEETLAGPLREKALIEFMTQDMEYSLQVRRKDKDRLSEEERRVIIFTEVQRALFKLDDATISLHLIERFYPNWNNPSRDTLLSIAQDISSLQKRIQEILNHPLKERFYQVVERKDTPYLLLGDILSLHPSNFEEIAGSSAAFEGATRTAYDARLTKLKGKIRRAGFFSTLSVFLSKVLIAFAVEIPAEQYFTGGIHYSVIAWSIAIPPLFLLFLISTKKPSSQENLQRVLLETSKIAYKRDREEVLEITLPRPRKGLMTLIVGFTYLSSFLVSFGILTYLLLRFQFSILSAAVFLLFLSLVSYAGTRIRQRTQELIVAEQKEGMLFGILDFFTLPITEVGKWLSGQFARYNLLVLLLNILIETPFQVFVEFIEQLRNFWKERKEQIH